MTTAPMAAEIKETITNVKTHPNSPGASEINCKKKKKNKKK